MTAVPKLLSVLAFAGLAFLLAGCQSAPVDKTIEVGCVPTAPGAASEAITVTGDELPMVDLPEDTTATVTERSVLSMGDGRIAGEGAIVTFAYMAYNGASGEVIDSIGYDGPNTQATVDEVSLMPGLAKALLCGKAGSRIAAVIPPADLFGAEGNEQYGIGAGDSIVFVIDVVAVAAKQADGKDQPPVDGLPIVEVTPTGEPNIEIPETTPPSELKTAVLKKGDGEVVTLGATVTIEYRGVIWANKRTFDSSWTRDDLVQLPTTNFVPGFGAALVGQSVGSQILAVIPPAQGYGSGGNAAAGISGTDTIVFVVDILAVVQPLLAEDAPAK